MDIRNTHIQAVSVCNATGALFPVATQFRFARADRLEVDATAPPSALLQYTLTLSARSIDRTSQFFLNSEGRVPFAGNMSFDFRSAPRALTAALAPPEVLAQVVKDCQVCMPASRV